MSLLNEAFKLDDLTPSNSLMTKIKFNSICRLCIQSLDGGKVCSIFNNEMYDDKISLSERIKYCSSVEVSEEDELPSFICSSCLLKLNQSFVFRNQCVLSDIILRHMKNDNFSMNKVSDLLRVDIQNQIIKLEIDNHENTIKVHTLKGQKNLPSEEIVTDEYDNSKNGRHKRNICKSKEHSTERVKSSVIKQQKKFGLRNLLSSKCLKNSFQNDKKVIIMNENETERENQVERNKPRTLKPVKEIDREKNKVEINVGQVPKTEIESFTVEPDIFNLNESKENKEIHDKSLSINLKKDSVISIKKNYRPKSSVKKERSKKLAGAKKKPSFFTCEYCQKVYPSEGGWRYHIHTVHNKNYQPFICDLCGQSFKVKKNLEGHKNSVHFHLKLHLCDLCGRGFASKYALKVHKIWHNDEKNFSCDICGTKFRTRGKMNTHKSIHGGPKKFMCHICSRDFRWKKDFEIHMRTHTGEKPFKCAHCGKAFASLTNMKKHEKNHLNKGITGKETEGFEVTISNPDDRMYKNELLDFGFDSEEVRYREINQILS